MPKTAWYESENPDRIARGVGVRVAGWIVVSIVFALLIGGGLWAFRVITSDVKGQGDAVATKNAAPNRIAAQERFEALFADLKASDARLDQFAADVKADPKGREVRTRYTGGVAYCISVAADYDALARQYRSQDFRAVDLPAQIDRNDPATDCKEN